MTISPDHERSSLNRRRFLRLAGALGLAGIDGTAGEMMAVDPAVGPAAAPPQKSTLRLPNIPPGLRAAPRVVLPRSPDPEGGSLRVENPHPGSRTAARRLQGVTEIAYLVGCYALIGSLLNTFDVNLPGTELG